MTKQDLSDLLVRVEGARGPDRELDACLWLRFVPGTTRKATTVNHFKGPYVIDETRENFRLVTVPPYTASLDAALALVERVRGHEDTHRILVEIMANCVFCVSDPIAPQLCRYLLAAMLKALIEGNHE